MLTLSTEFTQEFDDSNANPVFLVQVYTATSSPLCFCTGPSSITLDSIYNPFTGGSIAGKTASPSIAAVSQLNIALDPFERNVSQSNVTVSFIDDGAIRDFLSSTRLLNQAITIKLGTSNIPDEADWSPIFRGLIVGVSVQGNGIVDVECKDYLVVANRLYLGNFINRHPLEVAKKLLEDQGVPAHHIDADSFDFAEHDDIAHFVMTHWNELDLIGTEPIPAGPGEWYPTQNINFFKPINAENITSMLQEIAKTLIGTIHAGEDGKFRFARFSTSNTVRAHWTDDDIKGFKQLESIYVNEVFVNASGRWDTEDPNRPWGSKGDFSGKVKIRDMTSQTNFAFPGEDEAIFTRKVDFGITNYVAKLVLPVVSGGGITLKIDSCFGLCGTRTSGDYLVDPATTWSALQAVTGTDVQISVDRPLYVMVDQEVMKCTSMTLVDGSVEIFLSEYTGHEDPDDLLGVVLQKPNRANLVINSGNRGMFDTSAAEHAMEGEETDLPIGHVLDMTMPIHWAEVQLQRFSNGCPIIEVETSLAQWAMQLGDFVTLDNDQFLAHGFDGLTSAIKWEVVGKELNIDDNTAVIRWRLAYATQTSPPTIDKGYKWPPRYNGPVKELRPTEFWSGGISPHIQTGFGITSSGLVVTVAPGMCGGANLPIAKSVTVPASKDHYFYFTPRKGCVSLETVTTGDPTPTEMVPDSVILAKVVADGSTCTITDLREFGAVRPRNMNTTDFEQGANLIPNPDFEAWSRGPGYPPDHWEVRIPDTQDWIDDFTREETTTYSGRYALNMNLTWGYMGTLPFRVEKSRVYQFGVSLKASHTGVQQIVQIDWLDADRARISVPILVNHNASSGTTDMTRYDVSVTAPDTAVYGVIILSKFGTSGGESGIYDALRLVRSKPSFFVTNTTQTLPDGANTVIDFDIEAHDYGSNFDVTLGQNKFTAPFAGVYNFSAQLLGSKLTNGHIDSYLYLTKNGSELVRGSQASLVRAKPCSFLYTNTTQSLTKSPAETMIDFDVVAHDSGSDFNPTLGQNKFTAPVAGTYTFSVQILASSLTNGHVNSYIYLAKNGSEVIRGSRGYNAAAGYYDFKIECVLELAAADYLQVKYYNGHASASTFTGSTTENFFSGGLMQETISDNYDYKVESGPVQLDAADYVQVVYHNAHASDSVLTGSTTQNYFSGKQTE